MPDKRKAILLRISPDLWESLNRWAAIELRSVNAQIEFILREAVRRHDAHRDGGPSLWQLYPSIRKLADGLRDAGQTDWAHRIDAVTAFGGDEAQVIDHLRAALNELAAAPTTLPAEATTLLRALLRVLGEASG